jgi:hypothetical protein
MKTMFIMWTSVAALTMAQPIGRAHANEQPWQITCTENAIAKYGHGSADNLLYLRSVAIPKCKYEEAMIEKIWTNALMHGLCEGKEPIECVRELQKK